MFSSKKNFFSFPLTILLISLHLRKKYFTLKKIYFTLKKEIFYIKKNILHLKVRNIFLNDKYRECSEVDKDFFPLLFLLYPPFKGSFSKGRYYLPTHLFVEGTALSVSWHYRQKTEAPVNEKENESFSKKIPKNSGKHFLMKISNM